MALAIGSLTVAAAQAAGLGSGTPAAVLGQPLDFAAQLRLEPGETLAPECVSAEVTAGERRIPPSTVRTQLEMTGPDTARVRVQTQGVVDEPVVGVLLGVGCTARMSRRYVLLADPPGAAAAAAPAFAANPAPVPVGEAASAPASSAQTARPMPLGEQAQTGLSTRPPRAARPKPILSPAQRAAAQAAARERREALAARASARAAARAAAQNQASVSAAPRLTLEPEAPVPTAQSRAIEEALAAVAQAASAARAAASAASASEQKIAALQRSVETLSSEAKANRDLAAELRQRLNAAESSSVWMLPLMVVSGLLAALAAWLAWRLGRVQAVQQQRWRDAVAPPLSSAMPPPPSTFGANATEPAPGYQGSPTVPFVTKEVAAAAASPAAPAVMAAGAIATQAARGGRGTPAWPPPAPPVVWPPPDSTQPQMPDTSVSMAERTQTLSMDVRTEADTPRDVSIEELIDLEQQADFFVVLGQDDAAIELLMDHVRGTGGGSPLPYLKLLEIHHRRKDREAYDRMRARFNHRFNAYAPEYGVDLTAGRALDDYPGVIPRLQEVWPRPLDAMAELEALLFRKSRGELFDLPAYREVLFLYSLARDLLDRAAADNGNVDLLLPLTNGAAAASNTSPFQALERDAFRDTLAPDDRPTAPLDFDVTGIDRPTSIFDLLDDKTQPKRP
jgi:pilus assembly protein FimV